jgi:serralysin
MPTVPIAFEAEVAFLSGVTSNATVAGTSFGTWLGNNPATYSNTTSWQVKWGSPVLSTNGTAGGNVTYFFDPASNWTTTEKNALISGLALWSAVCNITFSLASSAGAANFTFFRNSNGEAFQTFPNQTTAVVGSGTLGTIGSGARISIDTSVAGFGPIGSTFDKFGGYPYMTLVHEIGHMLGLGHAGPYNGTVNTMTQQFSVYDTLQWTLMSYIEPREPAKFAASYPVKANWGINSEGYFYVATTPMILDIAAVQRIYGTPTQGPLMSDGLVFGFHSNIAGPAGVYFDFNVNTHPVITIWAGGVNNTLDLSGFSANAIISLTPGTFTSAGGMTNNIGIAFGTVIETAIGGSGNDLFIGGAGNHTFNGNTGTDTVSYSQALAAVSVNFLTLSGSNGFGGTDVYLSIERAIGSSFGDSFRSGLGNDYFEGGGGADSVTFTGLFSNYTISILQNHVVKVSGPDGVDTLKFVESLVFADQTYTLPPIPPVHDFNGDGMSDLLWRYGPSGFVQIWGLNGSQKILDAGVGTMATSWKYLDTGDFNGDGKSDIAWRFGTSGFVQIWELNGTQKILDAGVGTMGTAWNFLDIGDFNADGKSDIAWRYGPSGFVQIWELNGNQKILDAGVGTMGTGWNFLCCGDFTGDGKSDIAWRFGTSGFVQIWGLNGNQKILDAGVGNLDNSWKFLDTGDFNGDGIADLLWRHTNGTVKMWCMNGTQKIVDANVGPMDNSWKFLDTGDFNGDGFTDIAWRHDSGFVQIWGMNGPEKIFDGGVGTMASSWTPLV